MPLSSQPSIHTLLLFLLQYLPYLTSPTFPFSSRPTLGTLPHPEPFPSPAPSSIPNQSSINPESLQLAISQHISSHHITTQVRGRVSSSVGEEWDEWMSGMFDERRGNG